MTCIQFHCIEKCGDKNMYVYHDIMTTFELNFQARCKDFEETKWYESLIFFGFKSTDILQIEDDDIKLIPGIIEKVIVPKLNCK